ncbi:MAG TPA: serine hydroxymethyltransferase [Bacillota bacterium]|nr:serine hydroxymethyltransferase [Bacillota bacterium]
MGRLSYQDKDSTDALGQTDPEIAAIIEKELLRQQSRLELIASENIASRAVLQVQGSILTNKYAEGYPKARYYGGCEYVDAAEELACRRAMALFGAEHANVQPHAGAPANLAVYVALLKPGDSILGMDLAHGGHLTHGAPASITGRYYRAYSYGVDRASGLIDLDQVRSLALKVRPRLIIAGASAYPRHIDFSAFAGIAHETGAFFMVDMAHVAGLIAAGLHPNPVPLAHVVTSTTHKTLRGPRGGFILCRREYAAAIDKAVFPGLQGGPLMHVIAAKAVAFKEAQTPEFIAYQKKVLENAAVLAQILMDYGYHVVTGGTDTHMILLDLRSRGITGLEAERLLDQVGITANKNAIPFDPQNRRVTSGLRLGTPVVTSRGMGPQEMELIGRLIHETLESRHYPGNLERVKKQVSQLCSDFPIY